MNAHPGHYRKTIFHQSFPGFVQALTAQLHKEGFEIVSVVDISKVLKAHLQADTRNYKIISVIIPHLFNEMLSLQPFAGFVLPSHISVCETKPNEVEVIVVDPTWAMAQSVDDPSFLNIADETTRRLALVIDLLSHKTAGPPDGLT